jgi:hypothetical protein
MGRGMIAGMIWKRRCSFPVFTMGISNIFLILLFPPLRPYWDIICLRKYDILIVKSPTGNEQRDDINYFDSNKKMYMYKQILNLCCKMTTPLMNLL